MRFTTVFLADSATIRDGLLNVIDGGINRVVRDSLPSTLNATLVLMVRPDDVDDLNTNHTIKLKITTTSTGKLISDLHLSWPATSPPVNAVRPMPTITLLIPTEKIKLTEIGLHELALTIDDRDRETLEFIVIAEHKEAPPIPSDDHSAGRRA